MESEWNKRKRSGAIKRRIAKEYLNISKNQAYSGSKEQKDQDTIPNQTNLSSSSQVLSTSNAVGSVPVIFINDDNDNSVQASSCTDSVQSHLSDIASFSCSSESSSDDEFSKNILFRVRIMKWAVERNITQIALNDLATIVNDRYPRSLPSDARTILGTAKKINMKNIEHGEYWHNGLTKSLTTTLQNWNDAPTNIALNFNFDGLPIFKSSNKEFWPILCSIFERPDIEPFVIGIYFGVGKPKHIEEYLDDFVKEITCLIKEGIYIEHLKRKVSINVRCFICDSPARAYIKGVSNFNSKHGCLKCVTVGEYSHVSHTVVFPGSNCLPRTDQEFREKKYGLHHKKDSPILKLPIDIIQDFPVADSLHLVDLGIMKRLLVGWRNGNFGKYITKWRAVDTETVSNFLIKRKLPSEIHRSVRGLDCISHWKASEYRSFLFYLSIVILPDVLQHDAFTHFLTFFCGITICSSKNYSHLLPLAKDLLKYFVEHYKDFYGADYITSNVHNLLHVTEEVQRFGPLHTFSAYPFENRLYSIKRMLRHGNKPLAQVAKRFSEESTSTKRNISQLHTNCQEPFVTTNSRHLAVLHFKDYKMSSKQQDKYFLCNNNDVLEVIKIHVVNNEIKIRGYRITELEEVFERPVKSSMFNIFKTNLCINRQTEILVSPQEIKFKLVCTEHKNQLYFIPLLHTV